MSARLGPNIAWVQKGSMVSFARHERSKTSSFPRKRESTAQTFGNALSTHSIPAFAGMTGIRQGRHSK